MPVPNSVKNEDDKISEHLFAQIQGLEIKKEEARLQSVK